MSENNISWAEIGKSSLALIAMIVIGMLFSDNQPSAHKTAVKGRPIRPSMTISHPRSDTMRIIGVRAGHQNQYLYLVLVTQGGELTTVSYELPMNRNDQNLPLVTSFERGDTVVMKQGRVIKNLTQQRLIDEFIRQK